MLAPPSASSINIRRHSSHNCNAAAKSAQMRANQIENDDSHPDAALKMNNPEPPPVPKRTLIGKLMSARSFSESPPGRACNVNAYQQHIDDVRKRNTNKQKGHQSRRTANDILSYGNDQCSDDDRLSIESVFEEPKSSDPIIFPKSNRSSSDSNKSHGTIDTGYMSATNDSDRIFFGASEDFRTRFSSVETQSSVDSSLSADSQPQQLNHNHSRCIISPLAAKRDDGDDRNGYPTKYSGKNGLNAYQPKLQNNMKIGPASNSIRMLSNVSNRIQVPSMASGTRPRPLPPPPIRPQSSLDSGRIFNNGTMLGAFQSGIAKITSAASDGVIGRKLSNAARQMSLGSNQSQTNQSPSKLNHRQDSTLSSDSFSMTSSPGFNTKNMEAPLLQHSSRIIRSNCVSKNDTVDGFNMTSRFMGNGRKPNLRQDSNVSSDSQASSPGYNSKMSEQPLLAQAIKINARKYCNKNITVN